MYLSLHMMYLCIWWHIIWCWNMEFFMSTVAHFFFKSHISPWSYSLSHSYLYSILFLTLLYILPLFTQLGCVCLPRFSLFCFLFVYLWCGFLVLLFVCYFCDLVFLLLLVLFCFAETARLSQYSHISLLVNKEIRRIHLCRLDSKNTKPTIIQMQKIRCKQFVELARFERVMTTRAEFHFNWVYTFSATPRSLRIWATHPPRETGCDPAPPAQLCWSSDSSFLHMQSHELKLDSNKANLTVEGHRLDKLPVPSMPWRPCTNLCFVLLNINYIAK